MQAPTGVGRCEGKEGAMETVQVGRCEGKEGTHGDSAGGKV